MVNTASEETVSGKGNKSLAGDWPVVCGFCPRKGKSLLLNCREIVVTSVLYSPVLN